VLEPTSAVDVEPSPSGPIVVEVEPEADPVALLDPLDDPEELPEEVEPLVAPKRLVAARSALERLF
jgi:hypothetical protein